DDGMEIYDSSISVWKKYVGSKNPTLSSSDFDNEKQFYFTFDYGKHVSFFVLDTRAYASPIYQQDSSDKTKLGAKQLQVLFKWLKDSTSTFKFLASPVAWAQRVGKLLPQKPDIWANYLFERNKIFAYIAENNITGVILLSGDLHWSHVFEINSYLYEFGTSPMQTFGLPKWIHNDVKEEKLLFVQEWKNTFGQIQILKDEQTKELVVHYTLFGYYYLYPSPVYELKLRESQLVPKPYNKHNFT
ncbi:unnamed protein product, partial [Didymodactylos carnosus]